MEKKRHVLSASLALIGMLFNTFSGFAATNVSVDTDSRTTVTVASSEGTSTYVLNDGGTIEIKSRNKPTKTAEEIAREKEEFERAYNSRQTGEYGPKTQTQEVKIDPVSVASEEVGTTIANLHEEEKNSAKTITAEILPKTSSDYVPFQKRNSVQDLGKSNSNTISNLTPPATVGDPVLISSGKYYINQTDETVVAGKNEFNVDRKFVSSQRDEGAFGHAWTSSLDTRIIRGRSEVIEELYPMYKKERDRAEREFYNFMSMSSPVPDYVMREHLKPLQAAELKIKAIESDYNCSIKVPEYNKYSLTEKYSQFEKIGLQNILFIDETGTPHLMEYDGSKFVPSDESEKGSFSISYKDEYFYSGFNVTYMDGTKWTFNEYGRPTKKTDIYGSVIEFIYPGTNYSRVTGIRKNGVNVVSISYNSEKLVTKISNLIARTYHTYEYDSGFLTKVSNQDDEFLVYFYDEDQDVNKIVHCDYSKICIDYKNSEELGKRVVSVTNEDGFVETYAWDSTGKILTYTDASGEVTVYKHNDKNQLVSEQHGSLPAIVRTYNEKGNVKTYSDGYGKKTYEYNSEGFVSTIKYSDGTSEKFEYNSAGKCTKITDRDNVVTTYVFDSMNNCVEVSRAGKVISRAVYNSWGAITAYDGLGGSKSYGYDSNGNLISDKNYHYTYDSNGRLVLQKSVDGEEVEISYPSTHVVEKRYSNGLYEMIETNQRGHLARAVQIDTETGLTYVKKCVYDKQGHLSQIFYGQGNSENEAESKMLLAESYGYDGAGKLCALIRWNDGAAKENEADGVAKFFFWENGNLVAERSVFVDYRGILLGEQIGYNCRYYFENGLFVTEKTGADGIVSYCFTDEKENVVKTVDGEGRQCVSVYSAAGKLLSATNEHGLKFDYKWDNAVEKVSKVLNDGKVVSETKFDAEGNVVSEKNQGELEVSTSYLVGDDYMIVTKVTGAKKESLRMGLDGKLYSRTVEDDGVVVLKDNYVFENHGRRVVVDHDAMRTYQTFDAWNRIVGDSAAGEEYTYDVFGRISSVKSRHGSVEKLFQYDSMGKLSRETVVGGNETDYCYNPIGQLVLEKDLLGTVWEGVYDGANRLVEEKGRGLPGKRYVYDDASGLLLEIYEGSELVEKRVYSDDFRIVEIVDGNGKSSFVEFDEFGNTVSYTDRLGNKETYSCDVDEGTRTVVDFAGRTVIRKNDSLSNKIEVLYESEKNVVTAYNSLGAVSSVFDGFENQEFFYNENHQIEKIISGTDVMKYEYDSLGRLTGRTVGDKRIRYAYSVDDDLISVKSDLFGTEFEYDDFGREIRRVDENGTSVIHKYDVSGRCVLEVMKDANGSIVFGEGVVYGDKGKIEYTVNDKGEFNHYEYDGRGRLKEVYCSYREDLEDSDRKELMKYGENLLGFSYEYISVPAKYKQTLVDLVREMGSSASVQNSQKIWKTVYEYDGNSNCVVKSTALGNLSYEYDAENRLVKIGTNIPVTMEYDVMGNLVKKNDGSTSYAYMYDESNKLLECTMTDAETLETAVRKFRYDGMGRAVYENDGLGNTIRYVYDGLSFDVIMSYPVELEAFGEVSVEEMQAKRSAMIGKEAEKLRYINALTYTSSKQGETSGEGKIGVAAGNEEMSEKKYGVYPESRMFVYANDGLCWQENGFQTYSVCMDQKHNVRAVTESFGTAGFVWSYDSNGNPNMFAADGETKISTSVMARDGIEYAFGGKKYDVDFGMYNFGHRFYMPDAGRFLTMDPVKDGWNWYTYCSGDSINFYDPDGLKITSPKIDKKMQNYGAADKLGDSSSLIVEEGCLLVAVYEGVKDLTGKNFNIHDISKNSKYFEGSNLRGDLVASNYGLEYESKSFSGSKKADDIVSCLDKYSKSKTNYAIAVAVSIELDSGSKTKHFLGTDGTVMTKGKVKYLKIVGTSKNDIANASGRHSWINGDDGSLYMPLSEIESFRVFSTPGCKEGV